MMDDETRLTELTPDPEAEAPEAVPASEVTNPEAEAPETLPASEVTDPEEESAAEPAAPPVREDALDMFGKRIPKPYHQRYYLLYGRTDETSPLALNDTHSFLQSLGFDGGELHQARAGKDYAETLENAADKEEALCCCSYCGREISGIDFYRLPDGRTRCTTCSDSIVKSRQEVEEIYARVLGNLDSFFGASFNVPIGIEVMDERRLKRKIGRSISGVDEQSVLILGVAINRKKKYSILLENGAPRISLIATFAHELTHIWQYTHWDEVKGFQKCPPQKRLVIYEGMAKWAEIQYLYLVGETAVARREEAFTRARKDAYGVGFCLYEDRFPLTREAMRCGKTPFTPGRYPFDD